MPVGYGKIIALMVVDNKTDTPVGAASRREKWRSHFKPIWLDQNIADLFLHHRFQISERIMGGRILVVITC